MQKEDKYRIVQDLAQRISENGHSFYITDIAGLTVNQTNELRKLCHDMEVHLQVVKNKLVLKTLDELNISDSQLTDVLKGSTSIMIASNMKAPAQLIKKFREQSDKPVMKAAYIQEAVFVGDDQVKSVLDMKSKEDVLGEVITLLQSPATNVISALQAPVSNLASILAQEGGGKLAGLIKAIEDRNAA